MYWVIFSKVFCVKYEFRNILRYISSVFIVYDFDNNYFTQQQQIFKKLVEFFYEN